MPNGIYPVPKFRFEHNRRAASAPASPWLRLTALVHRDNLDRQLAQGVDPLSSQALELRAEQLSRGRTKLAVRLEGMLEVAQKPAPAFTAAVPLRRAQVLVCADDLIALARRLTDDRPVDVQGVAMTSVLLSDGASPLYWGDRSLAHSVRAARLALDPIGESLAVAA